MNGLGPRQSCFQEYPPDPSDALYKSPSHFDLFDSVKIDSEDNFTSWTLKRPAEWSSEDIIDWIYSVADPLDMKLDTVCGESYQGVSGQQLCRFSVDQFLQRDHINGQRLYSCLQELLQQSQFFHPSDFIEFDDSLEDIESLYRCGTLQRIDLESWDPVGQVQPIPSFSVFLDPLHSLPFDELSLFPFEDIYNLPPMPSLVSSCTVDNDGKSCAMQDSGYESAESSTDASTRSSTCPSPLHGIPERPSFPNSTLPLGNATDQMPSYGSRPGQLRTSDRHGKTITSGTSPTDGHPPKRKPGRPPKRPLSLLPSSSSSNDESCFSIATKNSKKKKTHLWKFMRALLEDPAYNPNSIKWENKKDGVFRIVPGQSKFIAKLWGQSKNNPSMTFDKMSRSLRWCRTYGFLSETPKDGNYPKKLCFRFGDRAANWQM